MRRNYAQNGLDFHCNISQFILRVKFDLQYQKIEMHAFHRTEKKFIV